MSSQVERSIEMMETHKSVRRAHCLPDILLRTFAQTFRTLADKISKVNIEKKTFVHE